MIAVPTAVRRSIIALLLCVAALSVYGLTRLDSGTPKADENIIESINPGDNDKTLQQGQLTVDLLTGWDASLSIDQKHIPDDQLVKVREQGKFTFQPGRGKELEYFPAGQNCVILTYWQIATGPSQSFTKTWCFTAT